MKIIVKISDVEVIIERPAFKEAINLNSDAPIMRDVILPTLKEATATAKELYELKLKSYENNHS